MAKLSSQASGSVSHIQIDVTDPVSVACAVEKIDRDTGDETSW